MPSMYTEVTEESAEDTGSGFWKSRYSMPTCYAASPPSGLTRAVRRHYLRRRGPKDFACLVAITDSRSRKV